MSDNVNPPQGEQADDRSADEIERDLKSTREDLEETLEALNAKLDVKTRATAWAKETADRTQVMAKALIDERGRELAIAGGALVLGSVAFLMRRGKR